LGLKNHRFKKYAATQIKNAANIIAKMQRTSVAMPRTAL
jgi:hypothetical protein